MAFDGKGHKGYLQLAREAAYGVAATPATHRIPFLDVSIRPVAGRVDDNTLDARLQRLRGYQSSVHYEGTIRIPLNYAGHLLLWDGVFGTDAYGANGGTTTGAGPFTHSFVEREYLNSYTVQVVEGDVPATKCQRYLGLKVEGFEFDTAPGGDSSWPSVTFHVVALDKETNQTPTAGLTAIAVSPCQFHQITTKADGSADPAADVVLRRLRVSHRVALLRQFDAGSLLLKEPVRQDWPESTFEIEKNFRTRTWTDLARAYTLAGITFEWVNGSLRFKLEAGTCEPVEHRPPELGVYGVLSESMTWRVARDSGLASGLKLTIVNNQATITS